jgi:hypothetical protein
MSWWKTALYDTCSLITLDKLLQDAPSLSKFFPQKVWALKESFNADQMRVETSERLKDRTKFYSLPSLAKLANLLSSPGLSKSLADVDKLVYATAVDSRIAVVTGDKRLAKAIEQQGLEVGNMALILQELVREKKLGKAAVEKALIRLAERQDFLLGMHNPTWDDLKDYTFPD